MVASLNFNPMLTTNAAGSFSVTADGFWQGIAMDDPALRNELAGGVLSSLETLPMWGGVGIAELIPSTFVSSTPYPDLGPQIQRANSLTGALALTGFSVFDQGHHGIVTPQNNVPLFLSGMSVHFYRLGSGIRIPVACDPALVSLRAGIINPQVSWDFVGQKLVTYEPTQGAIAVTGASWAAGIASFVTAAHNLVPGNTFTVTGLLPAGYNGTYTVLTAPDNTHLTAALAVNPGAFVSAGTIVAGGGALNVKVLDILTTNCKTVTWDPVNLVANWNSNGACALILL